MKGLKPLTLELDKLLPQEDESRIGNPLQATLEDARVRKGKKDVEKEKRQGDYR